jgi:group II intron reverse transcriptase/maturase
MTNLETPSSVQKLQRALHAKAKESPQCRCHSLYDKVYRTDILAFAYACSKANQGVPGVDGRDFADIEEYGLGRWLDELSQELRGRTYRPEPVRRVYIPKPDDPTRQRPLGIPTIRDRVAQMAVLLVLAPIFEADLPPEQYAYREGWRPLDAVQHVHRLLNSGYTQVVDADLRGYFDSIPHAELMKCLARRIVDGSLLHLLKMWLEMPVEETDDRGHKRRTTRARDEGRGTPQGAPISPLLSNLYMRRFVLGWKVLGHGRRLGAVIVNYADDFVICCRGTAAEALATMRGMMAKLKLAVNETKTRVCTVGVQTFDFMGYTFGVNYSPKTGRAYIGNKPARTRVARICRAISEETDRSCTHLDVEDVIGTLNPRVSGWANYFRLGAVTRAYRAIDEHMRRRVRQWLSAKYKRRCSAGAGYTDRYLHDRLGLVSLLELAKSFPWAKAR